MRAAALSGRNRSRCPRSWAPLRRASRGAFGALVVASVFATLLEPRDATAASLVVDRVDDAPTATACTGATDDCSLRGAILTANALAAGPAPEASEITLPAGTYALSQATSCTYRLRAEAFTRTGTQIPLCVNARLTIRGAGASSTFIDGGNADGILFVSADADVALHDLTIRNGSVDDQRFASFPPRGGGIHNEGTLALADAAIARCRSLRIGGGLYNAGVATIERSELRLNEAVLANPPLASGGAIYADTGSTTTIVDSDVSDNTAQHTAGAIYAFQADLVVRGSTFARNLATFNTGGALQLDGALTARIENATFNANDALQGGAIYATSGAQVDLASVTIAGNSAGRTTQAGGAGGGLVAAFSAAVRFRNTILAGNFLRGASTLGPDCFTQSGSITSQGFNLVQSTAACTIGGDTTGSLVGVDAQLAPLADNGGPTETMALLVDGPAVDAGNPAGCTDSTGAALLDDQRGNPRAADGDGTPRCDIGAFELGGSGSGPSIARVQPAEGGNAGSLLLVVRGLGFEDGAVVRLRRSGEPDVVASQTTVGPTGQVALADVDLAGAALGAWDVTVANPDGSTGTASGALTVAAPRDPDVWAEIVGSPVIRVGRPSRYHVVYGNRGNRDAFAVPLLLGTEENLFVEPRFTIEPPPQQFGKITTLEFGAYYQSIITGEGPPLRQLPLLLSVVPAGFTGVLELIIESPLELLDTTVPLVVEDTPPLFDGAPDAVAVARLVAGAREKCARLYKYALPTTIDPAMAAYLATQLDTVVAQGRAALLASFGTRAPVYSLSQMTYDLASFALVEAQNAPPLLARAPTARGLFADVLGRAVDELAGWCAVPPAYAQFSCACGAGPRGLPCCAGCSCPPDKGADVGDVPGPCKLSDIRQQRNGCKPPRTPAECKELGFFLQSGQDEFGRDLEVCTDNPRCKAPNPVDGSCVKFPLRTISSRDPNDKSGPLGGDDAGALRSGVPLAYTIRFENKPEATAPAADVVITDQLDAGVMDLAGLSLGALGFGTKIVVPPPGSTTFTQDVDLRPGTPLLVRIDAGLDPATAILSWRFTSLDPDTMLPPTDPLAGFLPPNDNPPEGDGFVTFTVDPKPALATGTVIDNDANIVFDVNDPIVTPTWRNTIDATPPSSSIDTVASAGACSQDLLVGWSGSDTGSGVGSYTLLVSEDGGPAATWTSSTATSGTFSGAWGRSYAFRSVAYDRAGNAQPAPSASSATVAVPDCGPFDLAVTKIAAPKSIKLDRRHRARRANVKVQIQNRSAQAQTIADTTRLERLVTLQADSLGTGCPAARVVLHQGKPQKALPLQLRPKQKLTVHFDVLLDCAVDPAGGAGHEDFSLRATVAQTALGGGDAHPADDSCPRPGVKPPIKDPFPDGRISEAGCGAKDAAGVLGAPVLLDVSVKE